jgi:hypothetical protein
MFVFQQEKLWLCRLYLENGVFENESKQAQDEIWNKLTLLYEESRFKLHKKDIAIEIESRPLLVDFAKLQENTDEKTNRIVAFPKSLIACFSSNWLLDEQTRAWKLYHAQPNLWTRHIMIVLKHLYFLPVTVQSDGEQKSKVVAENEIILNCVKSVLMTNQNKEEKEQEEEEIPTTYFRGLKLLEHWTLQVRYLHFLLFTKLQKHFNVYILRPNRDVKKKNAAFNTSLELFQACKFLPFEFSNAQIKEMISMMQPYIQYIPTNPQSLKKWIRKNRDEEWPIHESSTLNSNRKFIPEQRNIIVNTKQQIWFDEVFEDQVYGPWFYFCCLNLQYKRKVSNDVWMGNIGSSNFEDVFFSNYFTTINKPKYSPLEDEDDVQVMKQKFQKKHNRILEFLNGFQDTNKCVNCIDTYQDQLRMDDWLDTVIWNEESKRKIESVVYQDERTDNFGYQPLIADALKKIDEKALRLHGYFTEARPDIRLDAIITLFLIGFQNFGSWDEVAKVLPLKFIELEIKDLLFDDKVNEFNYLLASLLFNTLASISNNNNSNNGNNPMTLIGILNHIDLEDISRQKHLLDLDFHMLIEIYIQRYFNQYMYNPNAAFFDASQGDRDVSSLLQQFTLVRKYKSKIDIVVKSSSSDYEGEKEFIYTVDLKVKSLSKYLMLGKKSSFVRERKVNSSKKNKKEEKKEIEEIDELRRWFWDARTYFYCQTTEFPNVDVWFSDNPNYETIFMDRNTKKLYLDPKLTLELCRTSIPKISHRTLLHFNPSKCMTFRKDSNLFIRHYSKDKQNYFEFQHVINRNIIEETFYEDKIVYYPFQMLKMELAKIPLRYRRWIPYYIYNESKMNVEKYNSFLLYDNSSKSYSIGFYYDLHAGENSDYKLHPSIFGTGGGEMLDDIILQNPFYTIPLYRYGFDAMDPSINKGEKLRTMTWLLIQYCNFYMFDEACAVFHFLGLDNWKNYSTPYYSSLTKHLPNSWRFTPSLSTLEKQTQTLTTRKTTDSFFDSRLSLLEKFYFEKQPYKTFRNPIVHCFEHLFGNSIYDTQWEIVQEIVQQWKDGPKKEYRPIHLLMGQGKSKVIMPLLVLYILFQERKNAVLIVPPHLLNSTVEDIKRLYQTTLNGYLIHVNPSMDMMTNQNNIKMELFSIFILTDFHLKSLLIDVVKQEKDDEKKKATKMKSMRDNCVYICDEIDTLMNPSINVLNQPVKDSQKLIHLDVLSDIAFHAVQKIKDALLQLQSKNTNLTIVDVKKLINIAKINADEYSNNKTLHYAIQQLKNRFSSALYMIHNVQYGWGDEFDTKFKIVPYNGLNKPNNTSVYSDPYLLIWLTILTFTYHKQRIDDVEHLLHHLIDKTRLFDDEKTQMAVISDWMTLLNLKSTNEIPEILFEIQTKPNAKNKPKSKKIQELFQKNSWKYVKEILIPETTKYTEEQINVSFLDVMNQHSLMKQKCGFSGTFVPYQFEYFENKSIYEFGLPKPDQKTIDAVQNVLSDESILKYDIEWSAVVANYDILIDACAKFKSFEPKRFVELLNHDFQHDHYAFIYIDFKDQPWYYLAKEKIHDKVTNAWLTTQHKQNHSLFIYYDQGHTVGTDILQTGKEKGLITFDSTCQFNAFAQAAFRMRHLISFSSDDSKKQAFLKKQVLHVWIDQDAQSTEIAENVVVRSEDKKQKINAKTKTTTTSSKKRKTTATEEDDEEIKRINKKRKTNVFNLLEFLQQQQTKWFNSVQRELAHQNLKYLNRCQSKYSNIDDLKDKSIYEWQIHEKNQTDPIVLKIQKDYNGKEDLLTLYHVQKYCLLPLKNQFPNKLCGHLKNDDENLIKYASVSVSETQNQSQQQETKQNISTEQSQIVWSKPSTNASYINYQKEEYWKMDNNIKYSEEKTSWRTFISPAVMTLMFQHEVYYFHSKSKQEIRASWSHNLFWQNFPWFILYTSSSFGQPRFCMISEQEVYELIQYIPHTSYILDKYGRNIKSNNDYSHLNFLKISNGKFHLEVPASLNENYLEWSFMQCLCGNIHGLKILIKQSLDKGNQGNQNTKATELLNLIVYFYSQWNLTYLQIPRIAAYFVTQKQLKIDEKFFAAIGVSWFSNLDVLAQKHLVLHYQALLF